MCIANKSNFHFLFIFRRFWIAWNIRPIQLRWQRWRSNQAKWDFFFQKKTFYLISFSLPSILLPESSNRFRNYGSLIFTNFFTHRYRQKTKTNNKLTTSNFFSDNCENTNLKIYIWILEKKILCPFWELFRQLGPNDWQGLYKWLLHMLYCRA